MEGMSSEQLSWHLPGKWSAAEVLEHLYLTYVGTTRGLEKVMTRGAPLATRPSMAQRVLTFVVVKFGPYLPDERPPQSCSRGGCRWSRCETKFGQSSRRWMRSSRSVKPASAPCQAARPSDSGCADFDRVENAPSGARTAPPETAAPASQTHVRGSVSSCLLRAAPGLLVARDPVNHYRQRGLAGGSGDGRLHLAERTRPSYGELRRSSAKARRPRARSVRTR